MLNNVCIYVCTGSLCTYNDVTIEQIYLFIHTVHACINTYIPVVWVEFICLFTSSFWLHAIQFYIYIYINTYQYLFIYLHYMTLVGIYIYIFIYLQSYRMHIVSSDDREWNLWFMNGMNQSFGSFPWKSQKVWQKCSESVWNPDSSLTHWIV